VEVFVDDGGVEAKRFGASTSGETMLYDESGDIQFHGGITGARGHEGDNAGRRRVLELLRKGRKGRPDRNESPTFGCEI
jgi:hypothetical protein